MIHTQFKVLAVSSNTNSFGLHGMIITDPRGNAFEIAVGSLYKRNSGEVVFGCISEDGKTIVSLENISYEIPRRLPALTENELKNIWK